MSKKITMFEGEDYDIVFEAPTAKFNAINCEMVDERNGVNLGGGPKDFCLQAVYIFGLNAATYILNKRPSKLSNFLVRYEHLTDLTNFMIPYNVDKSKIKELAIISNVLLTYSKLLALGNKEEAFNKSPYKEFIPDLYDMFVEMFPKYGNKKIDYHDEVYLMASKSLQDSNRVDTFSNEKICEIWACSLAAFLCEDDDIIALARTTPGFIEALFSLPLGCPSVSKFMGYTLAVDKYAEKKTFYNDCVASNVRKSKTLPKAYEEIQLDKLLNAKKLVESVCKDKNIKKGSKEFTSKIDNIFEDYAFSLDKYSEEIASILIKNGYDITSDISKNDILLAMQTRGAFGVYNGDDDKYNINKLIADITISVLSRKYKELLLKNEETSSKGSTIKTSYDDKLSELSKIVEKLREENKMLSEKVSLSSNKDNRKDTKIQALEDKISSLNDEKKIKDAEINTLRKQIEKLESKTKENNLNENSVEIDYKEVLNKFSQENSVVIVGGNPNLISKIKPIFENITFILDTEKSKITVELIRNAKVVLYKTDSLGHSTWECASSKCKTFEVPEGYVGNITNVDALARNICESIENTLDIKI